MTKILRLGPLPQIRNCTEDTYTLSTGVSSHTITNGDPPGPVTPTGEPATLDGEPLLMDGEPVYMEV